MRVSEFDGLDQFETEGLLAGSPERNWIWFGLIVSLAIHFGLCAYFYRTRFAPAEAAVAPNEQTPTFKVRSITESNLDKSSADQTTQAAKPNPDNTDVQLPDEKKSFDKLLQEVQSTTAMPDDTRDALPDKPRVEQPDATSVLSEIERTTAQTLSKNPNATQEQSLLNDTAISGRPQPALDGNELATSTTIKRPNSFTSKIQADSAGPRFRNEIAPAGRSAFPIRQRRIAAERNRAVAKTWNAHSAQPEGHIYRGGIHGFVWLTGLQSRSQPAPRRRREGIFG
jgi:hypothetical protein